MNVGVELIAESRFDKQLGPHVRRWAYCHLLFDKCSYALLTQGASLLERIVAWFLMPLLRRIVYSALYCNRPGAKERSLQIVEAIFKEVFVWFPFSPVLGFSIQTHFYLCNLQFACIPILHANF